MKRAMGAAGLMFLGMLFAWAPVGSAAVEPGEQSTALAQPAAPEEPADAAVSADETEYAYGVVQRVADGSLVVNEYDLTAGKTVVATYGLDPKVTLTNVRSLDEIAAGDGVDIDYIVRNGARVATAISVEKAADEELQGFDEDSELY